MQPPLLELVGSSQLPPPPTLRRLPAATLRRLPATASADLPSDHPLPCLQIADALAPPLSLSSAPMGSQQQPAMMIVQQQQPSSWHWGAAGRWGA